MNKIVKDPFLWSTAILLVFVLLIFPVISINQSNRTTEGLVQVQSLISNIIYSQTSDIVLISQELKNISENKNDTDKLISFAKASLLAQNLSKPWIIQEGIPETKCFDSLSSLFQQLDVLFFNLKSDKTANIDLVKLSNDLEELANNYKKVASLVGSKEEAIE